MASDKKHTLVLGIGNELLTDDGIGPKIVKQLKKELSNKNIFFDTAFMGGLDILEFIQGYKTVIFIDAIKTQNGKPGDVYLFTPDDFNETLHLSNLHDISFLDAISMGEKIGLDIPANIHIIAIEIVEDMKFNSDFSPLVARRYTEIYSKVTQYIKELTQEK